MKIVVPWEDQQIKTGVGSYKYGGKVYKYQTKTKSGKTCLKWGEKPWEGDGSNTKTNVYMTKDRLKEQGGFENYWGTNKCIKRSFDKKPWCYTQIKILWKHVKYCTTFKCKALNNNKSWIQCGKGYRNACKI